MKTGERVYFLRVNVPVSVDFALAEVVGSSSKLLMTKIGILEIYSEGLVLSRGKRLFDVHTHFLYEIENKKGMIKDLFYTAG